MKSPPDDVKLSREDGDALIARLQANTVTSDDRQLLVKLIQLYFWFTFALRKTKISLKRLKRALFGGGKPPPPYPPTGDGASGVQTAARWRSAPSVRPYRHRDRTPCKHRRRTRRSAGRVMAAAG
jgi:hypothetical protein